MPKKENEKIKYKTQKAKKVKYPEAKIQLFDYDQVTGSKKENKEKAKKQKQYQKQKLKEIKAARKKEKQENQQLELDLNINNTKNISNKKIKKKKGKGIVKFILFIILILGIIAFLKSPFFTLQKINVKGNNKVKSSEIIKLSQIETNKNMFQKNLLFLNKNLKKNTYIKNASLKIVSSSEIELDIEERDEKYYISASNKFYTIDNSGMILKESITEPTNLIKLSIFKTELVNIKVGEKLNESDIKDIEDISNIIKNYIYTIKSDIEISEAYYNEKIGYVINLSQEKKVVYLGDKNKMETKILYLKKIIEQEKGIEGEIFLNKDFKDKFPVFREKV
jgi:hypothetical protein